MTEKEIIYQRAMRIFEVPNLTWEEKYDLIFSDSISKKVNFEYYDPDTSYEEDVKAFMEGFKRHMEDPQRQEEKEKSPPSLKLGERYRAKLRSFDLDILSDISILLKQHGNKYVLKRPFEYFFDGNEVGEMVSYIDLHGFFNNQGLCIAEFSNESMGYATYDLLAALEVLENEK